jgi:hypothetical protein
VDNSAAGPLEVALSDTVDVEGTVGFDSSANTIKIDPAGNTVKLDSNTVLIDSTDPVNVAGSVTVDNSATGPLEVALSDTVSVGGTVGLSDNTVRLDQSGSNNTVKLADNTVKIDPSANSVKLDATGTMNVAGTVGLSSSANTVKIDPTTSIAATVNNTADTPLFVYHAGTQPIYGNVGLVSHANTVKLDADNNTVKVVNPSGEALDVNVVSGGSGGGGGSSEQPVQFINYCSTTGTLCSGVAYTVPAGKILKIEYVSATAEGTGSSEWLQVNVKTTLGGVEVQHALPPMDILDPAGPIYTTDKYRLSTQVTFYADENTNVESVGYAGFGGAGVGFAFMYSGYLMDKESSLGDGPEG